MKVVNDLDKSRLIQRILSKLIRHYKGWKQLLCRIPVLRKEMWTNVTGHVKHISSRPAGWSGIQDGFSENHQNIDVLELGANVIPYIN